jgi:hypothetical protein
MSTAAILDRLDAVVAELQALGTDAVTDDEVVEIARRVEAAKRRLAPVDHAIVNQLAARSVPFTHGCRRLDPDQKPRRNTRHDRLGSST